MPTSLFSQTPEEEIRDGLHHELDYWSASDIQEYRPTIIVHRNGRDYGLHTSDYDTIEEIEKAFDFDSVMYEHPFGLLMPEDWTFKTT